MNWIRKLVLVFSVLSSIQTTWAQMEVIPQLGHQESIVYAEFSPDGKWLATGGIDRVILLWDMQSGLHWTLQGLSYVVTGLDFNEKSTMLAASDGRGNIIIWDLATKTPKYTKDLGVDVGDLHFLPNDLGLMYSGEQAMIWNYISNTTKSTNIPIAESKSSVSISKDGKQRINTVKSLAFVNGKLNTNYQMSVANVGAGTFDTRPELQQYGKQWSANALSPENDFIALSDGDKIVVQNFKTGALVKQFNIRAGIRSLFLSKNGTYVVAGCEDGILAICYIATGQIEKVSGVVTTETVSGIVGYDQTNELVVGVDNKDQSLNFYDIKSKTHIDKFVPATNLTGKLEWDHSTKKLYALTSNAIITWDMPSLKVENREQFSGSSYDFFSENSIQKFNEQTSAFQSGTYVVDGRSREASKSYYFVHNSASKRLDIYNKSSNSIYKSLPMDQIATSVAMSPMESKLFVATVFGLTVYKFPSLEVIKEFPYAVGAPSAMRMSPDGKYIAVGKTSETVGIAGIEKPLEFDVDIYNIDQVTLHTKLKGHYSTVVGLAFTPDGKLFTGGFDGKINCWDYVNKKLLATMHGTDVDYYFITTSEGYYTLSKSAIDRIAFGNSRSIFPAAQLEIKLNRPDKVAEVFGYTDTALKNAYSKAYEKRIKQLGIIPSALDLTNLPEVKITSTNLPRTTTNKSLKFDLEAIDKTTELAYLKVLVNNVPIYRGNGLAVSAPKVNKTIELQLSDGLNRITVSVINKNGAESAPTIFQITCTTKTKPDLYVLAIGVSLFNDAQYNLTYAAKDAKDLVAFFDSKKQDYDKVNLKVISDLAATKSGILAQADFFSKAKVDDEVILFVASHGLLDDNLDYYIATTNMIFTQPSINGLKYSDLEGVLTNTSARNRLLMIDACHSGEVDKEDVKLGTSTAVATNNVKSRGFKSVESNSNALGLKNSFELMKEIFADMRNSSGATIISSASGTEFALESDTWKNGVFTYAVLNGLQSDKADTDKNDLISVSELKNYVFAEVDQLTHGKQHPTSRIENLQNNFVVASAKSANVQKYNPVGKWVNDYSYYGDKRKRYMEVIMNGVDIDVYVEAMMDYNKEWYKSTAPLTYVKVEPNKYRDATGTIIEMRDDKTLIQKDMYGNSDFDEIYLPTTTGREVANTAASNSQTTYSTTSSANTSTYTSNTAYASDLNGTWKRADGKTDPDGTISNAVIKGTADGISVTLSQTNKTYNYVKKSDQLYEYTLGSLVFKVEKNADGTLTINKYNFKR